MPMIGDPNGLKNEMEIAEKWNTENVKKRTNQSYKLCIKWLQKY